jgi:thymidylate synthase (FAD)
MKIANIEVALVDHCGTDLSVVNAARVSFHKESEFVEVFEQGDHGPHLELSLSDYKLINYLAKHKHFSPFNHAFLSFRVKAPIFVARQLVKHKFMPWNEVSRRYVDDEPEFFWPKGWRGKAENVKQGSGGIIDWQIDPRTCLIALETYKSALANGVSPEQARMVLPQNTMTEWVWSGTLGAFCDMLRLRLDPHTQYESQLVAKKVYEEVVKLFPVATRALLDGVLPTPQPI